MGLLERLPRVSAAGYRRIAFATLVSLILITLAGVTVRLTGSGMGCPSWPTCEDDSLIPRSEAGIHGVIELVNRLMSGLVGVVALVAVFGAIRRTPPRRDLVAWSVQVLAWVLLNALVGRFVIEHHLLPTTVIVHFLLAMAAVWSAVVLHHKATAPEPDPTRTARDEPVGKGAAHLLVAATAVTVVIGTVVTGSGPHAGDADAERLALDVGEVARIHGIGAVVLLVVTLRTSWSAYRGSASTLLMDRLRWLTLLLVGQGLIGYIQYFNGVPPLLVGAHVLGAALVWVTALRVWLAVVDPLPGRDEAIASEPVETEGPHVQNWKRCPVPPAPSR